MLGESFTQRLTDDESHPQNAEHGNKTGYIVINEDWHEIPIGDTVIGRDASLCTIAVNDKTLSKVHAIIESAGSDDSFIYDVGSTNGTKFGKMVLKPHCRYKINNNDIIKLGNCTIEYKTSNLRMKGNATQLMTGENHVKQDTLHSSVSASPKTTAVVVDIAKGDEFKKKPLDTLLPAKDRKFYYETDGDNDIFDMATQNPDCNSENFVDDSCFDMCDDNGSQNQACSVDVEEHASDDLNNSSSSCLNSEIKTKDSLNIFEMSTQCQLSQYVGVQNSVNVKVKSEPSCIKVSDTVNGTSCDKSPIEKDSTGKLLCDGEDELLFEIMNAYSLSSSVNKKSPELCKLTGSRSSEVYEDDIFAMPTQVAHSKSQISSKLDESGSDVNKSMFDVSLEEKAQTCNVKGLFLKEFNVTSKIVQQTIDKNKKDVGDERVCDVDSAYKSFQEDDELEHMINTQILDECGKTQKSEECSQDDSNIETDSETDLKKESGIVDESYSCFSDTIVSDSDDDKESQSEENLSVMKKQINESTSLILSEEDGNSFISDTPLKNCGTTMTDLVEHKTIGNDKNRVDESEDDEETQLNIDPTNIKHEISIESHKIKLTDTNIGDSTNIEKVNVDDSMCSESQSLLKDLDQSSNKISTYFEHNNSDDTKEAHKRHVVDDSDETDCEEVELNKTDTSKFLCFNKDVSDIDLTNILTDDEKSNDRLSPKLLLTPVWKNDSLQPCTSSVLDDKDDINASPTIVKSSPLKRGISTDTEDAVQTKISKSRHRITSSDERKRSLRNWNGKTDEKTKLVNKDRLSDEVNVENSEELCVRVTRQSITKTKSNLCLDDFQWDRRKSGRKTAVENGKVFKVVFTGIENEKHNKLIVKLGAEAVNDVQDGQVLVTDRVKRTVKFLSAIALGLPIVSVKWLTSSEKELRLLDPWDFLLVDRKAEEQWNFTLIESIQMWKKKKLLSGFSVYATKSTKPPVPEILSIVKCCGGTPISSPPKSWPSKSIVLTCEEDKKYWPSRHRNIKIVHYEFLLSGVLKYSLDFKKYSLI